MNCLNSHSEKKSKEFFLIGKNSSDQIGRVKSLIPRQRMGKLKREASLEQKMTILDLDIKTLVITGGHQSRTITYMCI